ncbi:folylpolyglutamate synthase, mitochondrial-like isoform X2 [Corticium candelabrum]|uniref:folylpolyglutamate synthase, mitochondrial-like isoform X2 n=1 Tax=Corticium candelabrum TaxID=121492 RepID=UPI002E26C804|nr:folylpolyglutamate synthase, mitochondrial-like isoform X2 [Corticium candelabrum]
MQTTYNDAVRALNRLQSNAEAVARIVSSGDGDRHMRMLEIESCLKLLGINVDDLDRLSVIHVSGTKGKGSVCAMVESILRHSSLKTGLYTSPHLVEVRERIRINGVPLSQNAFASYFWDCFHKLKVLEEETSGPQYFKFLTAMGYYVFLKEQVDVAIVEVGIGGQFDYTNIVRRPVVCGITALGYDHTSMLGKTIEKIAWHKAGIIKKGAPVFTVKQDSGGLNVIMEKARELELSLEGEHQYTNASLAIQICQSWLSARKNGTAENDIAESLWHCKSVSETSENDAITANGHAESHEVPTASVFDLADNFRNGLKTCFWPGRNQVISRPRITYFVDGAHTPRSLRACQNWFLKSLTSNSTKQTTTQLARVLMFNCTSGRDPNQLLSELKGIEFNFAIFCPNLAHRDDVYADQMSYRLNDKRDIASCYKNESAWHAVSGSDQNTLVFSSVYDAIYWLDQQQDPLLVERPQKGVEFPPVQCQLATDCHIQLLVTGSIHLVGALFRALGPQIAPTC